MIKESEKVIAAHIESGKYFEDAFNWYAAKYIFPITLRSYLLILSLLCILGLSALVYQSFLTFENERYPFPIYALDETKYFPNIRSLAHKNKSIERSFEEYFVKTYVGYRERYNYKDFAGENSGILQNKIKAFSSRKEYREYLEYIDTEQNPDSPIVKYKNKSIRTIKITAVQIVGNKAKIDFTATEVNGIEQKTSNYVAELQFQLDDIDEAYKRKDKVAFIVTSYKSYPAYSK